MTTDPTQITVLLRELADGNRAVVDAIIPLVYNELHRLAERHMARERPDHTLNATALVHEAYMKLVDQREVAWQNRAHFLAIAAQAMRRILINHAQRRRADKRGGGEGFVTFNDEVMGANARADELLALDDVLSRLQNLDERQAKVVEYRFFGGLKHEEIAEVLGVSLPTVRRDWRLARAWLSRELKQQA
jgi:RNA polymerase sigma factor (TIGR02999 family)